MLSEENLIGLLTSASPPAINTIPTISKLGTTTNFFGSGWYFIPPIALVLYSIYMAISSDFSFISKAKRIYYSFMSLIFVILLKNVNLIGIGKEGVWGTTPKAWSVILFSIIYIVFTILIDNYIISGYVFKEFGFLGTKFIKDEATETVNKQRDYISYLESSIKAQTDLVNNKFSKYIDDIKNSKGIVFAKYIKKIVTDFYSYKNMETLIEVYTYEDSDFSSVINKITADYDLNLYQALKFKNRLRNKNTYYLKINDCEYNLLHLIINSKFMSKYNIGIAVKLFGECNLNDQYILSNLIHEFELELEKLGQ